MELLTVGHGTLSEPELGDLLVGAGVEELVDVRRAPGSRRHPQVSKTRLEEWVPALGVAYRWDAGLGGWRRTSGDSPNQALRNDSFRGYADYMRTPEFWEAFERVEADAGRHRVALMCSESVYWRCHRRLIADAATLLRGFEVRHLGHDGRLLAHRLTEPVRVADGLLVYDRPANGGE